jgi:endonuclease G
MTYTGNVRFQLRKLSGGRLNIDDFSINDNAGTGVATRDDNMAMGNPSGAVTLTTSSNNYLMVKSQYALSYNNSRGIPNWVSWHLSTAWKGTAARCDCFTSDATLPSTFYHATTSNYTGSGFDRGHLCPSEDRDGSSTDNSATFLMTNITPQAPNMNQITWAALETYCRTLINSGNELYIIAGQYGTGGSGSLGGTTNTIASGNISVPAHFWKVIVVLPIGTDDVNRVTAATRVIAVDMPNNQTVNAHTWDYYRTTVDAIEASTGYDILSNVPASIQTSIESHVDTVVP